jgi:tRNA 2-thiouridine synthesizing protein A
MMHGLDLIPGAASPDAERADRVIDTTGLYCPVPIVRTGEAIRGMRTGERLEILSDDRVILIDLPAWCRAHGHLYEGAREEDGVWRLRVVKAERTAR